MLARINFSILQTALTNPASKTTRATASKLYSEFAFSTANLINFSDSMKEDEMAFYTISQENWMAKRELQRFTGPTVKVGDIVFADLGSTYKPEVAYNHPVIVLERVGVLYLVVPVTTRPFYVQSAYHPVDNPTGVAFYRKVGVLDGSFNHDCAAILSNMKTISAGRFIKPIGSMMTISDPGSAFTEIKNRCFELFFPRYSISLKKKYAENEQLVSENDKLIQEIEKLRKDLKVLEVENSRLLDENIRLLRQLPDTEAH